MTSVSYDADKERYEIFVDGELAGYTWAHPAGDVVVFPHTEIRSEYEGRGLATELIQAALDDVRTRGLRVRAVCPFVQAFLEKHPEYEDLVASS
jgi:predicted GNAT family acetyltransferase